MTFPKHKASLTLCHNDHKSIHQTAAEWIAANDTYDWVNDEAIAKATADDSIWTLQWYPNSSVGFQTIAAPTLSELLLFAKIGDGPETWDDDDHKFDGDACDKCGLKKRKGALMTEYQQWWGGWHDGCPPCAPLELRKEIWKKQRQSIEFSNEIRLLVNSRDHLRDIIERTIEASDETNTKSASDAIQDMLTILLDGDDDV